MKTLFLILPLMTPIQAWSASKLKVDCLGPGTSKRATVYLHGLENPGHLSREENENRSALAKIAEEQKIRIALPLAPICPKGQRCWAAKDPEETLATFRQIQQANTACWPAGRPYSIIGFSNGGYFAFKLYKVHQDKDLKSLIAFGSAGEWTTEDKINPLSTFHLAIGTGDSVLPQARNLAALLGKDLPGFSVKTFPGGHRIDGPILRTLL